MLLCYFNILFIYLFFLIQKRALTAQSTIILAFAPTYLCQDKAHESLEGTCAVEDIPSNICAGICLPHHKDHPEETCSVATLSHGQTTLEWHSFFARPHLYPLAGKNNKNNVQNLSSSIVWESEKDADECLPFVLDGKLCAHKMACLSYSLHSLHHWL